VPDRVFVAIDPPPELRRLLADARAAFVRADPAWAGEKAVAEHLMHLTLAFVGPVPDPALPALLERVADVAAGVDPFSLSVSRFRAVPSARTASMIWACFGGECEAAADLSAALRLAAGMTRDPRPFTLHLTVLRSRSPRHAGREALEAAERVLSDPGKDADRFVSVRSITVYASTLHGDGPTYERIAEFGLGPDGTRPAC
jgi:RNA 2',3'-cyclic 3'-phosphodiesterase